MSHRGDSIASSTSEAAVPKTIAAMSSPSIISTLSGKPVLVLEAGNGRHSHDLQDDHSSNQAGTSNDFDQQAELGSPYCVKFSEKSPKREEDKPLLLLGRTHGSVRKPIRRALCNNGHTACQDHSGNKQPYRAAQRIRQKGRPQWEIKELSGSDTHGTGKNGDDDDCRKHSRYFLLQLTPSTSDSLMAKVGRPDAETKSSGSTLGCVFLDQICAAQSLHPFGMSACQQWRSRPSFGHPSDVVRREGARRSIATLDFPSTHTSFAGGKRLLQCRQEARESDPTVTSIQRKTVFHRPVPTEYGLSAILLSLHPSNIQRLLLEIRSD
jgi:hypothetical protein